MGLILFGHDGIQIIHHSITMPTEIQRSNTDDIFMLLDPSIAFGVRNIGVLTGRTACKDETSQMGIPRNVAH